MSMLIPFYLNDWLIFFFFFCDLLDLTLDGQSGVCEYKSLNISKNTVKIVIQSLKATEDYVYC